MKSKEASLGLSKKLTSKCVEIKTKYILCMKIQCTVFEDFGAFLLILYLGQG